MKGIFKLISHPDGGCGDYDALVATECSECFIRVAAWKETGKNVDPTKYCEGFFVSGFSSHNNYDQIPWKRRIKSAWKMLRGRYVEDFEMFSKDVVNNFIQALEECRDTIFIKEDEDGEQQAASTDSESPSSD